MGKVTRTRWTTSKRDEGPAQVLPVRSFYICREDRWWVNSAPVSKTRKEQVARNHSFISLTWPLKTFYSKQMESKHLEENVMNLRQHHGFAKTSSLLKTVKLGCTLQSSGEFKSLLMPSPHPVPITSESLGMGPRHQYSLNPQRFWFNVVPSVHWEF